MMNWTYIHNAFRQDHLEHITTPYALPDNNLEEHHNQAVVLCLVTIATVSARHRPQKWLKRQRHGGLKCDTHNPNPTCLKAAQVCDGWRDCIDGSDEKNCPSDPPTTCPPPTMCPAPTTCPPPTTCPQTTTWPEPSTCPPPPFTCSEGEFKCNDGATCLPAINICLYEPVEDNEVRKKRGDGVPVINCPDSEDEAESICEAKCQ